MADDLSHFDAAGRPRMVDVGDKPITSRRAQARGRLQLSEVGWQALRSGGSSKGDPIAVAQVAAIQAAKRCAEWIPMAHPLPLSGIAVEWSRDDAARRLELAVEVRVEARTGVEMEALCAVSAGLLCVYDMLKAVDRGMWLGPIWLARKQGGRSGLYECPQPPGS